MEKKVRFAKFMKLGEAEELICIEDGSIKPSFKRIGGKIFKILEEEDDTVTISVDNELEKIDKTCISEILEYDKSEVLSALRTLKKVCRCHTPLGGGCDDACPFYGEVDFDKNCKLLDPPVDWVIVDEEIWRPIR